MERPCGPLGHDDALGTQMVAEQWGKDDLKQVQANGLIALVLYIQPLAGRGASREETARSFSLKRCAKWERACKGA